jgi:hypothetical protein
MRSFVPWLAWPALPQVARLVLSLVAADDVLARVLPVDATCDDISVCHGPGMPRGSSSTRQ